MYSFHKYWTAPTREVIQAYLDFRERYHVPICMGESGENTDDWIAHFAQVLNDEKIPWTFWPYKKMEKNSAIVTFRKPQNWDAIVEYARKSGSVATAEKKGAQRPASEQAQSALRDLLEESASSTGTSTPDTSAPWCDTTLATVSGRVPLLYCQACWLSLRSWHNPTIP